MNAFHNQRPLIYLLTLCLALCCTPSLHSQIVFPAVAPTQPPGPPNNSAPALMLARWDVLLTDAGADIVSQAMTAAPGDAQPYKVYTASGDAIRGAVVEAESNDGIEEFARQMSMSQSTGARRLFVPQQFIQFYQYKENSGLMINVNASGPVSNDATINPDGSIHLRVNEPSLSIQINEWGQGQGQNNSITAKMIGDATLQDGDAIAFLGDIQTPSGQPLHHLAVFEAFSVREDQRVPAQLMGDPKWWCDNGPEELSKQIDINTLWEAQATHSASEVPKEFQQTLEDGKIAQLQGITKPRRWLFCWWDGLGKPIVPQSTMEITDYQLEGPGWVNIHLTGNSSEWKRADPSAYMAPWQQQQQITAPYTEDQQFKIPEGKQLEIGVPVGPWKKIGEISTDGSTTVDGFTYRTENAQELGNNGFFLTFFQDGGSGDSVQWLTAVTKSGKEVGALLYRGMTDQRVMGQVGYGQNFQNVSLKDVDHLNIMQRKMQWISFQGFAKEPKPQPPRHVDPQQLDAALAKQRAMQMAFVSKVKANRVAVFDLRQRKQWDSIPADPKTPMGALRLLVKAAHAKSWQTLREGLVSGDAIQQEWATQFSRTMTEEATFRDQCRKQFDAATINEAEKSAHIPDFEWLLMSPLWQKQPDGTYKAGDHLLIKNAQGDFQLQWTAKPTREQFTRLHAIMDSTQNLLNALSSSPNMSADTFLKLAKP